MKNSIFEIKRQYFHDDIPGRNPVISNLQCSWRWNDRRVYECVDGKPIFNDVERETPYGCGLRESRWIARDPELANSTALPLCHKLSCPYGHIDYELIDAIADVVMERLEVLGVPQK